MPSFFVPDWCAIAAVQLPGTRAGQVGHICNLGQSENSISDFTQKSIIVVDDDAAVRDSLSVLLSCAGMAVSTFASAAELLETLEDQSPDCLVIDAHMPSMGGLELVERLNALGAAIPIILISGNMDETTRTHAQQAGVSGILKKPFSGARLIEAIRDLVG